MGPLQVSPAGRGNRWLYPEASADNDRDRQATPVGLFRVPFLGPVLCIRQKAY